MKPEMLKPDKMAFELLGARLRVPKPLDSAVTLVLVLAMVAVMYAGVLPLEPQHIYAVMIGSLVFAMIKEPTDGRHRLVAYPAAYLVLSVFGLLPLLFIR